MSALVPIASTISNNTQQIAILSDSSELILKLWCRPAPLCLASILKSVELQYLIFEKSNKVENEKKI